MSNIRGQYVLSVVLCYLIGAIPFSYLVARWRAGVDIRERGEGNVGARNVFHVVGPVWGVAAALLDIAKGLVAYLVASRLTASSQVAFLVSGFVTPLGHGFSPFLRFRGGKGVATATGFMLGLSPLSTLCGFCLYGLSYLLLRDANRALIVGILGVVLLPLAFGAPWTMVPFAACMYALLGIKKLIDREHEREVWARDPWQKGHPGFHRERNEETGP